MTDAIDDLLKTFRHACREGKDMSVEFQIGRFVSRAGTTQFYFDSGLCGRVAKVHACFVCIPALVCVKSVVLVLCRALDSRCMAQVGCFAVMFPQQRRASVASALWCLHRFWTSTIQLSVHCEAADDLHVGDIHAIE